MAELYSQILGLSQLDVYSETENNDNSYFDITGLPSILSYGKHPFAITFKDPENLPLLKNGSNLVFEFVDSRGTVIFSSLVDINALSGAGNGFIWIKKDPLRTADEIADGPAYFYIAGELGGDEIPNEWGGIYNLRSTFVYDIRKDFPNTSPLLLNSPINIQTNLNISESIEFDTGDSVYKRSFINITLSDLETNGGKIESVELAYNEQKAKTDDYEIITTYPLTSGSYETVDQDATSGLNPKTNTTKILTPTGFRRDTPTRFRLRFLNPAKQLAQYLDEDRQGEIVEITSSYITFESSPIFIEKEDNLLKGSMYTGNAVGKGFEQSGKSSAFLKTVDYEGFESASSGQGSSGVMFFSGSVLTSSGDNYDGVGLEMVANSESYFRFRTNPSIFDVRAQSFFVGSETSQYISGSDGNIEISSSLFHLNPSTNTLTLSGSITAIDGTIGGWEIESDKLVNAANTVELSSTTPGLNIKDAGGTERVSIKSGSFLTIGTGTQYIENKGFEADSISAGRNFVSTITSWSFVEGGASNVSLTDRSGYANDDKAVSGDVTIDVVVPAGSGNYSSNNTYELIQVITASFTQGDTLSFSSVARFSSSFGGKGKDRALGPQYFRLEYSSSTSNGFQSFLPANDYTASNGYGEYFLGSGQYNSFGASAEMPANAAFVKLILTGSINDDTGYTIKKPLYAEKRKNVDFGGKEFTKTVKGSTSAEYPETEITFDNFTLRSNARKVELTQKGLLIYNSEDSYFQMTAEGIDFRGGSGVTSFGSMTTRESFTNDSQVAGTLGAPALQAYTGDPEAIGTTASDGNVGDYSKGNHIHVLPFSVLNSVADDGTFTSIDVTTLTAANLTGGSGGITIAGDIRTDGDVIAQNYIVSSSVTYMTTSFSDGSTVFGNTINDTHLFTGSLFISGNLTAVNLTADSGSFSTRLTTEESNIDALQSDSGSFSTRVTLTEATGSNLVTDSGSFSTRVTALEELDVDDDLTVAGDSGGNLTIDLDSETLTIAGGGGMSSVASGNTITFNLDTGILSSSAQIASDISGSWRGELSSSALTYVGGGVSGSSTSTGSFGSIHTAGNVGIGTTSPDSLLHAYGSSHFGYNTTHKHQFTGSVNISGSFLVNGGGVATTAGSDTYVQFNDGGSLGGDGDFTYNKTTNKLSVVGGVSGSSTSTGSFGSVHTAGKVGIGTTAPERHLHVKGADTVPAVIMIQGGKDTVTSAGEINARLAFASNDGSVGGSIGGAIDSITELSNGAWTGLAFSTYSQPPGGGGLEEHMRIAYNGNVGIGTTSPALNLHVSSSARIKHLLLGDSSTGNIPTIPLWIKGSGEQKIRIEDSDNSNLMIDISTDEGSGFKIYDATNSNTLFFGDESGNVGIGTTAPVNKLHLYSTTSQGANLTIDNTQASSYDGVVLRRSGTEKWFIGTHGANSNIDFIINQGAAGTPPFSIQYATGNVGIGTTSPSQTLTVAGNISGSGNLDIDGNITGSSDILLWDGSTDGTRTISLKENTSTGGFIRYNGSSNQTQIGGIESNVYKVGLEVSRDGTVISGSSTSTGSFGDGRITGKLGIGSRSPQYRLDLASNDDAGGSFIADEQYIRFGCHNTLASSSGGLIWRGQHGGSGGGGTYTKISAGIFAVNEGNYFRQGLKFLTGNDSNTSTDAVERMRIDMDGNVGIGTGAPSQTLTVAGNISGSGNLDIDGNMTASGDALFGGTVNISTSSDPALTLTSAEGGVDTWKLYTGGSGILLRNMTEPVTALMFDHTANANATFAGNIISTKANGVISGSSTSTGSFGAGYIDNKLGIGTTSPDRMMEIEGSEAAIHLDSSANAFVLVDRGAASDVGQITYATAGSNKWFVGMADSDVSGLAGTEFFIGEGSGGSSDAHLVITDSGNVGIGTTSPSKKLHINSGTSNVVARFESSDADARIEILDSNSVGSNSISVSTDDMYFSTNSSERMRIDSSGNVGIGTTSPDNNLEIFTNAGDEGILVKSTGDTSNAIVQDANRSSAGAALGVLSSKWNGTAVADILFLSGDDTSNKDDAEIAFRTAAAGTPAEALRIDQSGNVGIGTTSPDSKLEISDATNDNLRIGTRGSNMNLFSVTDAGAGSPLAFEGSEFHFITGNVGIGTTTPNSELHVVGDIRATGNVIAENYIVSSSVTYMTQSFSSGSTIFGDTADDVHQFTGSLRVTGSGNHYFQTGNVGIGTTSPGNKLVVETTTDYDGIVVRDVNDVVRLKNGGADDGYIQLLDSNSVKAQIHSNGDSYLLGGDVGIGTQNPNQQLHIQDDSGGGVILLERQDSSTSGTMGEILFGSRNYDDSLVSIKAVMAGSTTSGDLIFSTEATGGALTERLRITSTGQISGSSTSTGSFGSLVSSGVSTLTGDVAFGNKFTVGNTTVGNWASADRIETNGDDLLVGTYGSHTTVLRTNNSDRITIAAGGDVTITKNLEIDEGNISGSSTSTGSFGAGYIDNKLGIGTTSPSYKLDVDGTGRFTDHLTLNGDSKHIYLTRSATNVSKGLLWSTAAARWFTGLRETSDEDFHIYNYAAGADILTFANTTGDATFGGNVAVADTKQLSTSTFISGVTGDGFRIIDGGSDGVSMEIDNIMVRNTLRTHMLQKDVVKASNGILYVAPSGVISGSSHTGTNSGTVTFIDAKSATFSANDRVWYKDIDEKDGAIKSVQFTITDSGVSAGGFTTYGVDNASGSLGDLSGSVGGTAVRISGGGLVLDASSNNSPYMDVLRDSGSTVVRTGNLAGITSPRFGTLSGSGFWASGSAYLEGSVNALKGNIGGWGIGATAISSSGDIISIDAGAKRITINDGSNDRIYLGEVDGGTTYGLKIFDGSGTTDANRLVELGEGANMIAGWDIMPGAIKSDNAGGSVALSANSQSLMIFTGSIDNARPKVVVGKLPRVTGDADDDRYGFGVFTGTVDADIVDDSTYNVLITRDKAKLAGWDLIPGNIQSDNTGGSVRLSSISQSLGIWTGSLNEDQPKLVLGKLPIHDGTVANPYGFAVFSGSGDVTSTVNADSASVLITANKARLAGWNLEPTYLVDASNKLKLEPAGDYIISSSVFWVSSQGSVTASNALFENVIIVGGAANNTMSPFDMSNPSFIGGGNNNTIQDSDNAFLGGGSNNTIRLSDYTFVAGGFSNVIGYEKPWDGESGGGISGSNYSAILGGSYNTITGSRSSVIVGGIGNRIEVDFSSTWGHSTGSFIGAGNSNYIQDGFNTSPGGGGNFSDCAIVGGDRNYIMSNNSSFIGGGSQNYMYGWAEKWNTIGGGRYNAIRNKVTSSFIGGGEQNVIQNSNKSVIAGGAGNDISSSFNSFIGGGEANDIWASERSTIVSGRVSKIIQSPDSTILNSAIGNGAKILSGSAESLAAGGGSLIYDSKNCVVLNTGTIVSKSRNSTIINGTSNEIKHSPYGTILNGIGNIIHGEVPSTTGLYNTILNGTSNHIEASENSFIGWGDSVIISGSDNAAVVCGDGASNDRVKIIDSNYAFMGTVAQYAYILGSPYSAIVSGYSNTISASNALGPGTGYNAILSGNGGEIIPINNPGSWTGKAPEYSVIIGGYQNKMYGTTYSTIVGGYQNEISSSSTVISDNYNATAGNFIGCGWGNKIEGNPNSYSSVVGGKYNKIKDTSMYTFIGGGNSNTISAGSSYSAILGGRNNQITGSNDDIFIIGSNIQLNNPPANTTYTENLSPGTDDSFTLGTSALRWDDVFAVQTTTGGIFESGLKTKSIGDNLTGTIVVWREDKLIPCDTNEDELVMGVIKHGKDEPIVLGAEPVLVTGKVKVGDYIVTSDKIGHGKSVKRGYLLKKDLFGKVIAQALEKSDDSESCLIKCMIRKF